MEDLPHIDTTEVIADGVHPDEPRVIAIWHPHPVAGSTETPIHINTPPFRGTLKPSVDTLMPACVAQMLVDSGYDVEVKFDAIVNPGFDAEIEAAIEQVEADASAKASAKRVAKQQTS
jgi:hypothetical protein